MGVLMQAFYWDCPREDKQEGSWWSFVATKLGELKEAGISALWLPPASKAANIGGMSMGYDVYDYWDLGKYDQKGSVKTWFGSEEELRALIRAAHEHRIGAYADLVLNHNNGADAQELNPITGTQRWTKFNPKSGLFTRDWTCFNPSPYPDLTPATFGDMPDLCHINPRVSTNILNHAKWLIEDIGYDGFRYDFVKGFASWMIRAIHDRTYHRGGRTVNIFGVAECWEGDNYIAGWLDSVNNFAEHHVSAFDFPLRYRLKDLCDKFGFSLRGLASNGVLSKERPLEAVTFVDNHDFSGADCVINDKMLAYAYILTHEGYPSVFWKDYFNFGLGRLGHPGGIARLVQVHEKYAAGGTRELWVDDVFYAMERTGTPGQPGLVFCLNNSGEVLERTLGSGFAARRLQPVAWSSRDGAFAPAEIATASDGACPVRVGPRGYVVYAPA
jgi:alpha-amylase